MFDSNQFFSGGAADFYPKTIEQSLRFNDDDSAYLSRTPASAGNRKTWTLSCWFKPSSTTLNSPFLFGRTGSGATFSGVTFSASDNRIRIVDNQTTYPTLETSGKFRDVSAWYHLVVAVDTTQATPADRAKIYINGQETSYAASNYWSQNANTNINSTDTQLIGQQAGASYYDGYLAEYHLVDGQALDADDFGELKSGVWVAKDYTGTYGTNGFYLDFANSADIGNDVSGNGNDWTPNNFTASDVVLDSPTDNFATLNPLDLGGNGTLSNGNLDWSVTSGDDGRCYSTIAMSSGKWYWEVTQTDPDRFGTGIVNISEVSTVSLSNDIGGSAYEWGFITDGQIRNNATASSYGSAIGNGGVLMVAFDADNGELYFGKNGTWFNSSDPSTNTSPAYSGLPSGDYLVAVTRQTADDSASFNFGQQDFTYTPPTGYLALSTANLPDPVIDPAQNESPSDYFNTVLYTGNSSNPASVTGVGFQPDFVWVKTRSFGNTDHRLQDVVRGSNKRLESNTTDAETDAAGGIQSFDADGFTVGDGTSKDGFIHFGARTFVAWNWKAGGSGVSNTDGSITSTVSANTTSGFSICTFTPSGNNFTFGHGLDVAPDAVWVKNRDDGAANWVCYQRAIGATKYLMLNSTNAAATSANAWQDTDPTASVVSVGSFNYANGEDYVAYCFHSVEGYSKFGSYTGNGSADGPFVYTGFRPAFIMSKRTDSSGDWHMYDVKRDPHNFVHNAIWANYANAEYDYGATQVWDILSNGFKARTSSTINNASGGTYIYMAFAENPFKYSNAR